MQAAAAKVQDFNAPDVANTRWAMAKIDRVLLEVFDSLCRATTVKVLDLNTEEPANTLWAMVKIGRVLSEVFDSLCQAAAGTGFPRAGCHHHAMGYGQDRQGPARGLRLAVPGSGSEGAGFQCADVATTRWTMAKIDSACSRYSIRCAGQRQ